MKTKDFDYHLPKNLIAEYPLKNRSDSKLLIFQDEILDKSFKDIINYFKKGDLLVLNNTSVIPARIFGRKETGGAIEILLERIMNNNKALVQIRSGNSPKPKSKLLLGEYYAECLSRKDNFFVLQFEDDPLSIFNEIGHIPLPPYINRADENLDKERYATVYEDRSQQGSVAAPTAGLHFESDLLNAIEEIGVKLAYINLSVGAGTFQPVKTQYIQDHNIHEEYLEVTSKTIEMVKETKANGNKVFAVGTTAVRALETAYDSKRNSYQGYTNLSIYPGYKFKTVDFLITNFHLPQSSLLMLVSAFIGFENMKKIYNYAVTHKYRFLSYGDAMLLRKNEV